MTTFQRARQQNEMLRIILGHRRPTYKDYINTPEAMQRLLECGVIKSMPAMAPIVKRARREYAVKYATEQERHAAKVEAKKRWVARQKANQ